MFTNSGGFKGVREGHGPARLANRPSGLNSYRYGSYQRLLFRLDALALSVIATATWLGGWLSVTAGIVSKRLNVSENFFDHLIAPS